MSQTVASEVRAYLPEVTGTVRLLEGVAGSVDAHLSGRAIMVLIRSETKRGVNEKTFGLRFHFLRGRLDRVTLCEELPAGEEHEAAEYCVDFAAGSDLGSLACNCMDYAARAHRRQVPHCRHSKAALKVATILGAL